MQIHGALPSRRTISPGRAAFLAVLVVFQPALFAEGDPPSDPISARVLESFREHGHYVDAPGYPKDHPYWKELQWYRDQGAAVRPALMYLLTDEYRGDYGKMSDVVMALKTAPGDQTKLLDFLRSELAEQPDPRSDDYYLLVNAALPVFSAYGNRSDLNLIRQYQADDDVRVRVNVKRHIEKLEERLAEQSNNPLRQRRTTEGKANETEPGSKAPSEDVPASTADGAEGAGHNWALWSAGCVLVVALVVFFVSRRQNP
ncbi:hypothetical protein [Haloferula sp. A504]|uniref:hypothetical protein n=1 Tax=Haloferula sp. A504 TaxID=3373601 RepID=UPI0031C0B470|nr:hypothetical protein [Verrucomicrobiaceae bacterium E54]